MQSTKPNVYKHLSICRAKISALAAQYPDIRTDPMLFADTVSLRRIQDAIETIRDLQGIDTQDARLVQGIILVHLDAALHELITGIRAALLSVAWRASRLSHDDAAVLAEKAVSLETRTESCLSDPGPFITELQQIERLIINIRKTSKTHDYDGVALMSTLDFIQKIVLPE